MSLEHEPPGIWAATCDGCGERLVLDLDGDEPRGQAEEELAQLDWVPRPVEVLKFTTDGGTKKHKVVYAEHDCADCAP